jgi:tetratricopeptide (TPR) repeat protein
LALLFGVLSAGTAAVFFWAQYHLDAARRALERYAFAEAQHHLVLYLKVYPYNAAGHLLAAQTARRCDAYGEADRHLAQCIQLGGLTPGAMLERMLLTAQQGELDGVETALRARAANEDDQSVLVLEALAKGYANRFWDSNTLVSLNMLLKRQPQHPHALLMRARVWEDRARKGETEREQDARRDYEKAIELNPTFEGRLGLAGTLYRMGRPWEAMLGYERLRAEQPFHPAVLLGLARCRYNLHEVDEARRLIDELLERQPNSSAAMLERGRLALHAGELAEAEERLRQAEAAAPRYNTETLRLLCRCFEAAGRTAEAQRCKEELRRKEARVLDVDSRILRANRDPRDVALRYEIATELMRLGRERDGVASLFFVLEQQPGHGPAREALIDYFEHSGQSARAARYRRAIRPGAQASVPSQ